MKISTLERLMEISKELLEVTQEEGHAVNITVLPSDYLVISSDNLRIHCDKEEWEIIQIERCIE